MIKIRRIAFGLLCAVALCVSACAPTDEGLSTTHEMTEPQPTPLPTVDGVIAELCSPMYTGRTVGSAGNEAASNYIAGFFETAGLAPFFEIYFQSYEDFVVYPERAEAKLSILSADGTRIELAAAMLETACLLATSGVTLKTDVIFAAFNGEESGMDGSKALAAELIGRYEQINVINIDCVGLRGSAGLAVYDEDGSAAQLQGALLGQLSGAELKVDYPSEQRSFSGSDGVQAVALADRDCMESGLFHTVNDTPDRLDGEAIAAAASGVAALLRADVVYAAPHPEAQQPRDGLTDAQRTLMNRLYEDGTVSAFGQKYINAEISPGKYEVVTGGSLLLHSAEEVREACANLVLPENIGEYVFLAAQISAETDKGSWDRFMKVQGEYEVGKVYDCLDQLRGTFVYALYAAPDGQILGVLARGNVEPIANLEGTIEGSVIDFTLAGYWLGDIYPQADGYDALYYEDARGVRAAIGSYSSDEALLAALRAPGATPNAINSLIRKAGYQNIMTKEDLIALAQSCDMPALTAMIEPRKQ